MVRKSFNKVRFEFISILIVIELLVVGCRNYFHLVRILL